MVRRCERHLSDPTSTVGVCASCLHHRLSLLLLLDATNNHQHNPIPRFYSTPQSFHSTKKKPARFSLILNLFRSHRRKTTSSHHRKSQGLSPEDDADVDRSPSTSWPSPARVMGHVAGMGLCWSPLVRASPTWHWREYSGECAVRRSPLSKKPHLSAAASFCANRSRKMADFGRLNRNR